MQWQNQQEHNASATIAVCHSTRNANTVVVSLWRRRWSIFLSDIYVIEFDSIVDGIAGDLAKHGVLLIQPISLAQGDEPLRRVRILPTTRHTNQATSIEFQASVEFIFEWCTAVVGALSAETCPCWVTCLGHEILDDAVKDAAIVVVFQTQLHEVTTCQRAFTTEQLDVKLTECGDHHHFAHCIWFADVADGVRHDGKDVMGSGELLQ